MKPARRRELVHKVQDRYAVSERRACRLMGQHRSTHRYSGCRPPDDDLRLRLRELAGARPPR